MARMLKVMEEARREATIKYETLLRKINKADEIARKVRKFLPEGWRIEFRLLFGDLVFARTLNDKFEFRNVCNLIEKITGTGVGRHPFKQKSNNEEYLYAFLGVTNVPLGKDPDPILEVNIWMYMPEENQKDCILEYEEKVIRVAKIDPGCLGNHEKNNLSSGTQ